MRNASIRLIPHSSSSCWRLAVGIEGRAGDLGHLAARGVRSPAEVGPLLPVARLARATAGIATNDIARRQLFDPDPERIGERHVGEGLLRRREWPVPSGGDCCDLGDLAAGGVGAPAEVRAVLPIARLACATAGIA